MDKHRLLYITLILCALSYAGWYVVDHLEWRSETIRSEQSPEALANPYHAGLLLMRQLGYAANYSDQQSALDTLPPHGTLLLLRQDRFATPELRQKLLDWVEGGGHLVLPISTSAMERELLQSLQIEIVGGLQDGGEIVQAFVEQYNIDIGQLGLRKLIIEGHPTQLVLHEAPAFRAERLTGQAGEWQATLRGKLENPDSPLPVFIPLNDQQQEPPPEAESSCDASGPNSAQVPDNATPPEPEAPECETGTAPYATSHPPASDALALYARFRFGAGMVTTGDFTPFSNARIRKLDHAKVFTRLLTLPSGPRPVLILDLPPYPGLFSWLIEHAPDALLVAALLLIAALRRVMPRFGPLLPPPLPQRPGLREHLAASGHYLLRHHCYEALLAPLRETVLMQLDRLQHRHPQIEGREQLGEHLSGIKAAEIKRALSPEPPNAHEFLRRARVLAALRQHCRLLQRTPHPGAQA